MLVTGSPGMKCIIKKTMNVTPSNVGIRSSKRRRRYSRIACPSLVGIRVSYHSHPATVPGCYTDGAWQRSPDISGFLASQRVAAVYRSLGRKSMRLLHSATPSGHRYVRLSCIHLLHLPAHAHGAVGLIDHHIHPAHQFPHSDGPGDLPAMR